MKEKKVLFITQEITPYVPDSHLARVGRTLPQAIQDSGCEIRTFMPKWGTINERRNQLHEVIRLSGMNIIIDDTDHPLIIKVASIQAARMQVYFIDNDEYFHKRALLSDDKGEEYADNAERAIFYARGVLETLKKLRWHPDVIHCTGWMAAMAPLYIKTAYREEPPFLDSKVIFSPGDAMPCAAPPANFVDCLRHRELTEKVVAKAGVDLTSPAAYGQLAVAFSDGYVQDVPDAYPGLLDFARERGVPTLELQPDADLGAACGDFYRQVAGDAD